MEKTINPTQMNQEEATLLQALFDQNKTASTVFKRKHPYTVHLPKIDGSGTEAITIKLKNTIIKRKREKKTDEVRYDIMNDKHMLGEGGFSQVYTIKATLKPTNSGLELHSHKSRVVKVQQHNYTTFEKELEELNREVNISEASEVMHIKRPAFSMNEENNQFHSYTVMRHIAGKEVFKIASDERDKRELLATHTRLSLTLNALRSLRELHRRSIIHRDIKLENMFFDQPTRAVTYIDYGLSKFKDITNMESCGTLGYIAPEIYNFEEADEKSDLYSLGIALSIIWGAWPQENSTSRRYEKPNFTGLFEEIETDLTPIEKVALSDWLKKITEPERNKRIDVETAIDELKRICRHYIQHHRSRQGSFHNITQGLFRQEANAVDEPIKQHHVHFSLNASRG